MNVDKNLIGKKVEQVIDEKRLIEDIRTILDGKLAQLSLFTLSRRKVEQFIETKEDIISIIEQQPQADKWIPCEERLPSEYGQYLYTDKNDEVHEGCYCPPLQGMIRGWSTCEAEGFVKLSDDDVIAWQPLPQQYKKEGAE